MDRNFATEGSLTDSTINLKEFSLRINRNDLLKTLSHINGVVEKRNVISILGNVKLEAKDGTLHLTATDMDIAITESIEADIEKESSITVPAQMLYEIVRKLGDIAEIRLELDQRTAKLNITAGNCDFTLPTLSSDNFPNIECNDIIHTIHLITQDLKSLISRTKFAISTEETRYNLNGIYFHYINNNGSQFLVAAATDGHRLSQVKIASENEKKEINGIILPRKAATELSKLLDDRENEVKIEISNTKVKFNIGNIILVSKLIDANFPDYQNFIPKNNDKILKINRESFAKAVDRVSILSIEKFSAVKLQLSSNRLDLTVNNEQYGVAHEMLEVKYEGESLEIAFNTRYILDIMSAIEGDSIVIALSDSYSPGIIKDEQDKSGIYIIMPMRV